MVRFGLRTVLWTAWAFEQCTGLSSVRGVSKADATRYYSPDEHGFWWCLDGSKRILFDQVNDDYCDCGDGSDEPGTSACPNGKFYCRNEGYKAVYISSSRVNDGICDSACCDGTDEWAGIIKCPNRCKELGDTIRRLDLEEAARNARGWAIRTAWVEKAAQLRSQLHTEIGQKKSELVAAQSKEADLIEAVARQEEKEKKVLKYGETILDHAKNILKSFQSALAQSQATMMAYKSRCQKLASLLDELRKTHNHELGDAGVADVLSQWGATDQVEIDGDQMIAEEDIRGLVDMDIEELGNDIQLESEPDEEAARIIYRLEEYIPTQAHKWFSQRLVSFKERLIELGFIPRSATSTLHAHKRTSKVLQATRDQLNRVKNEIADLDLSIEAKTKDLDTTYGPDDVFRALKDECVSFDAGEYTYEVCFLGTATQISNRDNLRTSLGTFTSFGDDGEDFRIHQYSNGQRCWNGPERSAHVTISCGDVNEIYRVAESQKCEYELFGRSPALCLEPADMKAADRDEL